MARQMQQKAPKHINSQLTVTKLQSKLFMNPVI